MYDKLKKQLEREEGRVLTAYKCTRGHWTIGIGHNLDVKPMHHGGKIPHKITDAECDAIFVEDVQAAIDGLTRQWKGLGLLSDARRDAVIQMSFQLGVNGVLKFKKMLKALEVCDWSKAYKEALDSDWAKQTPDRAHRVATQILTGVYYKV
jgi:lysozyme